MVKRRRPQAGFTLIELMISLVLFSIVISGALAVAVATTVGYREQREIVATEVSVRAPLEFLSDAIRNTSPGVATGDIQDVRSCTNNAITVVNSTVGPDQFDIVYASGAVVTSLRTQYTAVINTSITVTNASQIVIGDTLMITNTIKGHLVNVTSVNTGTGVIGLTAPACVPTLPAGGYLEGSLVIRVLRARFYVDVAGSVTDGVPTLMMDPDAGGPIQPEPLAENVEDMQVAVGVDLNVNKGIDDALCPAVGCEWEFSAGIGALAGKIRAMRITLIARSPRALQGTPTFFRSAAEDRPVAAAPDGFRRRVLTSTVEIRNLGDSP